MQSNYSFPSLTILRFFAAIFVALFHTINFHHSWPHLIGVRNLAANGWLCVDFFFILSGFVLMWSYIPNGNKFVFISKRIIRIYPLHIITLSLSIIALFVLGNPLAGYNGGVESAFLNFFLLQGWFPNILSIRASWNAVSWTLSSELFFYVTAPILFSFIIALKKINILAPLLIFLLFVLCLVTLDGLGDNICNIYDNCLYNRLNVASFIMMQNTTEQYINSLYSGILHRPADSEGLAYWVHQIDSGLMSREIVSQKFLSVFREPLFDFLMYHPLAKWIDFVFGASLALYFKQRAMPHSKIIIYMMIVAALFLIIIPISTHHYMAINFNIPIFLPIDSVLFLPGGLLLIYSVCCWDFDRPSNSWIERILMLLGEASFAIYMTHALALGFVSFVMNKFNWFGIKIENIFASESFTILFLTLFTLLGVITHKYLEQPIRECLLNSMNKYQRTG